MKTLRVSWKGSTVGSLLNPVPDMWYMEGQWVSDGNSQALEFEYAAKQINARAVYHDPSKGLDVLLMENESALPAVVISLADDQLFVRRTVSPLN